MVRVTPVLFWKTASTVTLLLHLLWVMPMIPRHLKKELRMAAGTITIQPHMHFTPKAGKIFFFRTAENKYVKMELLAVDYEPFVGPTPVRLVYRFRYTYQSSGSTNF